jgi:AcrR family transcriptional regulator
MGASGLQSPRESRRADELARRRADAVAAAAAVFAAKGYHDTQMTEIAAAAEMSRASLYALFQGKQELYQEAIGAAGRAIRDSVRSRVETLRDPSERLLCVIDSLFACYEENQDLIRMYALGTHGFPFKIREALGDPSLQLFVEFTDWVIALSKEAKAAGALAGLDPEAFGESLVGAVTTRAVRWLESAPDQPLSRAAPGLRAIFGRLLEGGASGTPR